MSPSSDDIEEEIKRTREYNDFLTKMVAIFEGRATMPRLRFTIEYDADWTEASIEQIGKERLLELEKQVWLESTIDANLTIVNCNGKVQIEIIG